MAEERSDKVPTVVECGNCFRALEVEKYEETLDEDVPDDKIHRRSTEGPPFTVLCTCGHFTSFSSRAYGLL